MESRVSGNCTRNIHSPPTPEKEVNRKENIAGKIARRRQIGKCMHDKENRDLSSKICRVSFDGISYDLLYCLRYF